MNLLEQGKTKQLLEVLSSQWNSKADLFPGPNPVSIERKHLKQLYSQKYFVGLKNDGERYALCCIRDDEKPRCFLLNRKLEAFQMSLKLSTKLYLGTILDCELVNNELFIFDVVLFAGQDKSKLNFNDRLDFADAFIKGMRCSEKDKYKFTKKSFVDRTRFQELPKYSKTDGYILVPNDKPILTGTNYSYFKWKPKEDNTIDFYIDEKYFVYLQLGGKLQKQKLIKMKSKVKTTDAIYECKCFDKHLWDPILIRNDKALPNSVSTYKHTLINIEGDIKSNELFVS